MHLNYVGNYAVFGPDSKNDEMFKGDSKNHLTVFQFGNYRDMNCNGIVDGSDDGAFVLGGDFDTASSEFPIAAVTSQTAVEALASVMANAGARPWNRDAVDVRILTELQTNTGGLIDSQDEVGGWPELDGGATIIDTDRDGVPDAWESANGTDPGQDDANGDANGDGYTNLKNYLHHAATNGPTP